MSAPLILQAVINGLLLGGVYAGMALGLSLTMGVLRLINVSHSVFVILGAFFALELLQFAGVDPVVSVFLSLPVFYFLGVALYRLLVSKIVAEPQNVGLLVLFGVMVFVESLAILVWTTDARALRVDYLASALVLFGNLRVSSARLVAGGASIVILGAVHFFLTRTLPGKAIRAMAQNRDAARTLGIDVDRLSSLVLGLGVATAAAGGVALGLIFPFAPQDHLRWLAWAFLIVIVGGLGSVVNTLVAGLALGLAEALAGTFLRFQYVQLLIYGLLVLAMIWRREGLVKEETRAL